MSGDSRPRACCFGLFQRRQVWVPSLRGWLLLAVAAVGVGVLVALNLYSFLAVNEPFDTGPVVVEGFAGNDSYAAAVAEFRRHGGPKLYVTGGALEIDLPVANFHTHADLAAWQMQRMGMPAEAIQKIPSPGVRRDRTFASAVAVRDWMRAHGGVPPQLTLVTSGPHARRSRLLYQRAFGSESKIGIRAAVDAEYDPAHWWSYSQGFRNVIDETVAYVYARLLFSGSG